MADILNSHPKIGLMSELRYTTLIDKIAPIFDYEKEVFELDTLGQNHAPSNLIDWESTEPEAEEEIPPLEISDPILVSDNLNHSRHIYHQFISNRDARKWSFFNKNNVRRPFPQRKDLRKYIKSIYEVTFNKRNIKYIGSKTPNNFDEIYGYLKRYHDARCILCIRNPHDIINSSLERRNMATDGLDMWHISSVEEAVREICHAILWTHKLVSDFPKQVIVVKYEDVVSRYSAVISDIARYLMISPNFSMNVIDSIPDKLRGFAIDRRDTLYIEKIFGDIAQRRDNYCLDSIIKTIMPNPSLGDRFSFGENSSNYDYLIGDCYPQEPYGRWITEGKTDFLIKFPAGLMSILLYIDIVFPASPPIIFNIMLNGYIIKTIEFSSQEQEPDQNKFGILLTGGAGELHSFEIDIEVDQNLIAESINRLTFHITNYIIPADLQLSDDNRKLGCFLKGVAIR